MASVADCDAPYTVRYFRGAVPIPAEQHISAIEWGRRLDAASDASVTHDVGEEGCCDGLAMLEPFADQMAVHRGDDLVWSGPVTQVRYKRGQTIVRAMDKLGWLLVRTLHQDHTFVATDLTTIFEAYWRDAIDVDPVPYLLDTEPTGVLADRTEVAAQVRYAWQPVKELLDTGLDATALGDRIVAGLLDFGSIDLSTNDFQGDPEIVKDGNDYGNRIWVKGAGGIVGTAGGLAGDDPYPLVELVRESNEIEDQSSADDQAASVLAFNERVPRFLQTPEGTALIVERAGGVQNLVPGLLVNLTTDGYCFEAVETYRLAQLRVRVVGSNELVEPVLQPVGSAA